MAIIELHYVFAVFMMGNSGGRMGMNEH